MKLFFTALACLISVSVFGQNFYNQYVEYFDTNGVSRTIEGIYSVSFNQIGYINNIADVGLSSSKTALYNIAILSDNNGKFNVHCSVSFSDLVISPTSSSDIYIGNMTFLESGLQVGLNISFKDNLLEYSYEKPTGQVNIEIEENSNLSRNRKKALHNKLRLLYDVKAIKLYPLVSIETPDLRTHSDNIRIRISELSSVISKVAVIGKESTLCDGTIDDGNGLAALVEGELLGLYGVVERKHLEEILDEQRLAMSGFILEDTDFANAGCLAGAQGTVLASYGCLQGKTKLQVKLVDCSTSDIYWSATGFDISEFDLLDALRSKLESN